jgi:hypothetical protein
VWRALDHQHILPLLGITYDFGRDKPMGMVCPWLDNGNLNGYLDRHGATLALHDRFGIVRSQQCYGLLGANYVPCKLCDVAAGLSYRE